MIVHPPSHVEGIQYKSSDYISHGKEPDSNSQGILLLGASENSATSRRTIWGELKHITDSNHQIFYKSSPKMENPQFTLCVVSNKPLKDYDTIKETLKQPNAMQDFPKGVIVVCHQNFQAYAASLAHRGLFLPLKK
jgi:hypothetical protein